MLFRRVLVVLLLACLPGLGHASAPSKEAAPSHPFQYIEMKPDFTVSFGTTGKIGYLKAGVSLRVANAAAPAVELHMPAIRHELLMLFSRQTPEALVAPDKREPLRLEALEAMRKLLVDAAQVKPEEVEDLLFTEFFTQR